MSWLGTFSLLPALACPSDGQAGMGKSFVRGRISLDLRPSVPTIAAKGQNTGVSGHFHGACGKYEIDLDLVCTSKPGVLSPLAGERVVGHGRVGPRRDGDVADA